MFETTPWLSAIIWLPLLAALVLFSIRGSQEHVAQNARLVAFWASFVTFLISVYLTFIFNPQEDGLQFQEVLEFTPAFQMAYRLGVDGLSLPFILLSTFMTVLAVLSSWSLLMPYVREYMALFLVMESFAVGIFASTDLLLFYIFFEGLLIPLFFVIGIWGGEDRIRAALKFFLYTIAGSAFFLIAVLCVNNQVSTFDMVQISQYCFSENVQKWLWMGFFVAFAVKIPLWPFHTWLPEAHVEAPTAGSVILAAVLLKAGAYGFLRLCLPFFPEACFFFQPLVLFLSVVGLVGGSLGALAQQDFKRLIAYSSIAHMAIALFGIAAMTQESLQGAVFQLLSHGVLSAGLFLCGGMAYERFHTRDLSFYGGLTSKMPVYACCLFILTVGTLGLPGTCGFVGEFLIVVGAFKSYPIWTTFAALGLVLTAVYSLSFYGRMILGPPHGPLQAQKDLHQKEIFLLAPLIVTVLLFGIYPQPLLNLSRGAIGTTLRQMEKKMSGKPKNLSQKKQLSGARTFPNV